VSQRDNFGVGRGIAIDFATVFTLTHDAAVDDNDTAHGHVIMLRRDVCMFEGTMHHRMFGC
jgi:hypothetical protein